MRGSRTSTLILAGALGLGTLTGLASPAFAETSTVLDTAPAPQPEPPQPGGPGEISDDPGCTFTHGCEPDCTPIPGGPCDLGDGGGDGGDEPGDGGGDGGTDGGDQPGDGGGDGGDQPGDGGGDGGTDGDDPVVLDGGADVLDGGNEPSDPTTPDGSLDAEVLDRTVDRGALPRTGAGVTVLAVAGGALTGVGAVLRKLARR